MRIVIDASVAVKWVIDEPESEAAVALRDQELIAPALWLAEAANALWRHARIGEIGDDETAAHFGTRRSRVADRSLRHLGLRHGLDLLRIDLRSGNLRRENLRGGRNGTQCTDDDKGKEMTGHRRTL